MWAQHRVILTDLKQEKKTMMPNFTLISLPVTEASRGAADTSGSGPRVSANMAVKEEDA